MERALEILNTAPPTLAGLRNVPAAVRLVVAEQALGQRDEKDAAAVHAAGEVDGRGRLTHDVADRPP